MYEQYYGFSTKPFQQRPDPDFYFGSKGHNRAAAYLEYGLSQGEGFIVVTGEVGAGKTTLVRQMFCNLPQEQIIAAHIANTHLDAADTLRLVANAFGLIDDHAPSYSKAVLLTKIDNFLKQANVEGKRVLLVVDEAQNLPQHTLEELRMLSNFHADGTPLLQTFLLGQPEFRRIVARPDMLQLRQRIIASCHLGPMDQDETRDYILHRLKTVGWQSDPTFSEDVFPIIHQYTGGIPRKINALCDRLLLMGYLEEMHAFTHAEVVEVIEDVEKEFFHVPETGNIADNSVKSDQAESSEDIHARIARIENALNALLRLAKFVMSKPKIKALLEQEGDKQ